MFWTTRRIYADAAAATPLSARAEAELLRALKLYGNPGALHDEALAARATLQEARAGVAGVLGAHADEIIFTSGGTEANNLATLGVLRPRIDDAFEPLRVHAVTSAIEHASVLEPLRQLRERGLYLTELPVNSSGLVSPQELTEAVTPDTRFVSIQLVNSEVGTIEPIREIAKEVRRIKKERQARGDAVPLYLHCDASQAPLWLSVKVDLLGVDLLTLDGQKVCGPKGVGALYVRRGVLLEPIVRGGGQERGLRSGTENPPLCASFCTALAEAQANAEKNTAHLIEMRNYLIRHLMARVPGVELTGAIGDQRVANNIHIAIEGLDGQMAVIALNAEGVAASTRSACDTQAEAPSHVLVALGLPLAQMQSSIRLTFLPNVTKSDMRYVARALAGVAKRYRNVVK